jgi:hypothetical protein
MNLLQDNGGFKEIGRGCGGHLENKGTTIEIVQSSTPYTLDDHNKLR